MLVSRHEVVGIPSTSELEQEFLELCSLAVVEILDELGAGDDIADFFRKLIHIEGTLSGRKNLRPTTLSN